MVQAYVLIQAEVGRATGVGREVAGISGVTSADVIMGSYDVIVRVEARSIDELGRMVVVRIQAVDGVTDTVRRRSPTDCTS